MEGRILPVLVMTVLRLQTLAKVLRAGRGSNCTQAEEKCPPPL